MRAATQSLPVRGAWVEMSSQSAGIRRSMGRSPCGERGLKLPREICEPVPVPSLPVRGAWVEIAIPPPRSSPAGGRSPCGERGLKLLDYVRHDVHKAVAPRAGSVG